MSRLCALVAIALISSPVAAQQSAADSEPTFQRPAYKFQRFEEDWSGLRGMDRSATGDFWDHVKYVPLSDDGEFWVSFGGHMRLRFENWSDFAFGAPADPDDSFLLWRLLAHADVHLGEHVRVFVEGKSALSTDRELPGGKRTLDVDSLDLQQGFADVKIPFDGGANTLTLRAGRQALLFGKQRLVSPLPWGNTLRSWDGVSGIVEYGDWNIHGFWTQFAPVRKYEFNDPTDDVEFSGVYASGPLSGDLVDVDLYWLWLDKTSATFNGTTGSEDRHTVGGRLHGTLPTTDIDYDFEGAYQFGNVGSGDIDAFMAASEFGYTVRDIWGTPRFKVGLDYASGDDTPGGDVETFNHLFPLGHAYLGYMDFIGRQNIIDISPGVSFKPVDKVTVSVTGHFFYRAEDTDAVYNAGGGVLRAGALNDEEEIGNEIDVTLQYKLDRHASFLLGYSLFHPGDFIKESGTSEDAEFIYAQVQYTF